MENNRKKNRDCKIKNFAIEILSIHKSDWMNQKIESDWMFFSKLMHEIITSPTRAKKLKNVYIENKIKRQIIHSRKHLINFLEQ